MSTIQSILAEICEFFMQNKIIHALINEDI